MRMPGVLMVSCLCACGGGAAAPADDLADGVLGLPRELREVSGICAVDERTLACLQDEAGALYFVDLAGQQLPRVAVFSEPGDFEGVARVGDEFWVLRSDGVLMRLHAKAQQLVVASTHRLPAVHREWEALCFDGDRKVLLAMPKDAASKAKGERDLRFVYAIDPATGATQENPVLVLDSDVLVGQAEARDIALPTRTSQKGKTRTVLRLASSEILAVPGTDHLLVLSAVDHLLLEVDRAGRLLAAWMLDEKELPQPESMAFLPDGRLLVASEGAGGLGVVRVLRRDK
ncbi:MAG TPA: SdiA-regulated domain-containing protein [Planctomycetota bacterium]